MSVNLPPQKVAAIRVDASSLSYGSMRYGVPSTLCRAYSRSLLPCSSQASRLF